MIHWNDYFLAQDRVVLCDYRSEYTVWERGRYWVSETGTSHLSHFLLSVSFTVKHCMFCCTTSWCAITFGCSVKVSTSTPFSCLPLCRREKSSSGFIWSAGEFPWYLPLPMPSFEPTLPMHTSKLTTVGPSRPEPMFNWYTIAHYFWSYHHPLW